MSNSRHNIEKSTFLRRMASLTDIHRFPHNQVKLAFRKADFLLKSHPLFWSQPLEDPLNDEVSEVMNDGISVIPAGPIPAAAPHGFHDYISWIQNIFGGVSVPEENSPPGPVQPVNLEKCGQCSKLPHYSDSLSSLIHLFSSFTLILTLSLTIIISLTHSLSPDLVLHSDLTVLTLFRVFTCLDVGLVVIYKLRNIVDNTICKYTNTQLKFD